MSTVVPKGKVESVARMLKAIHASQDRQAAMEKAEAVVERLMSQKLIQASQVVREGIAGTRWGTRLYLNMSLLREMETELPGSAPQ